jgi:hypothetical protein
MSPGRNPASVAVSGTGASELEAEAVGAPSFFIGGSFEFWVGGERRNLFPTGPLTTGPLYKPTLVQVARVAIFGRRFDRVSNRRRD